MMIIKQEDCNTDEIIFALNSGKTLVYPTETCYGLGCDATNQQAVDRIYEIKKREEGKPMIMLVPTVEMAKKYIVWNTTIDTLAEKYLPGPLTIVAEAKINSGLAEGIISNDGTVAIRVTAHPFASQVSETLGKPLVSTSANLAGGANPYAMETVKQTLGTGIVQPDMAIDAGVLPIVPPSTLVKIVDGEVKVLRQGGLIVE